MIGRNAECTDNSLTEYTDIRSTECTDTWGMSLLLLVQVDKDSDGLLSATEMRELVAELFV